MRELREWKETNSFGKFSEDWGIHNRRRESGKREWSQNLDEKLQKMLKNNQNRKKGGGQKSQFLTKTFCKKFFLNNFLRLKPLSEDKFW